jgi:molybdopterin-guanine dinucleotide biosynthesis protein A
MIRHGFLQAGGGSTRFGTDKALVEIAGKTMLRRTGELLACVCDDVHIVAPASKYEASPWPVLPDRWPGEGPLGGILTALLYLGKLEAVEPKAESRSWALVLSCDMPFLTHAFLSSLWRSAERSRAQVVVPQSGNGLEPLCACWRVGVIADVQAAFDAGVRKVTEAMKRVPMEVLDESTWKRFDSDGRLFWNMNTAEDYEEVRRVLEAGNR